MFTFIDQVGGNCKFSLLHWHTSRSSWGNPRHKWFGNYQRHPKTYAKRKWHSSHLAKGLTARAQSSSRFDPPTGKYRFLRNLNTKRPSRSSVEQKYVKCLLNYIDNMWLINLIKKRLLSRKRSVTMQTANLVLETLARRSQSDPCRGKATQAVKMQLLLRKCNVDFQKTILLAEMPHRHSEWEPCRGQPCQGTLSRKRHVDAQNATFVNETSDLYA